MSDLAIAFRTGFQPRWSIALMGGAAAGMFLLLAWSGQLLQRYPDGWDLHAEPAQLMEILLLALLFGALLPLEIAAIGKARGAGAAAGGAAGTITGLLSLSCCAPFVVPAILSFAGFSGTALLSFNGAIRQLTGPLTLISLGLMAASLGFVARSLAAACRVPRS